jgi:two-component system OmpR family sensor kinase
MIFNSIKWRLQGWQALLLLAVLAGFGFTAHRLDRLSRLERIDEELHIRVQAILDALRNADHPPLGPPDGDSGPPPEGLPPPRELGLPPLAGLAQGSGHFPDGEAGPPGPPPLNERQRRLFEGEGTNHFYFVLWHRDGRVLSKSESAPAEVPRPLRGGGDNVVRTRGMNRELVRFTPPGECVVAGRNLSDEFGALRRSGWLLLGAGAGVLALGLVGGWWLSAGAIRPIKDISATAARISAGDLAQRIPAADTENELGQLAAVLNSTFARLEAAFAQQRQFTSDAAHELRTPISVMLTQTQTALNRERSGAEYRQTIESCQRAAQRMRRLIESLLELARLDAGQEQMNRLPFDLSQTARDCAELIRPLAEERGVKMALDLTPLRCVGDSERIGQVITNLLANAVQYNRPGGEIRLSTHANNGTALLTVADTGQGIAPEALSRIFERFFRVDNSRSSGHAGLGLAISKAIVAAHGGALEASSQLGAGSTFTVRLPGA